MAMSCYYYYLPFQLVLVFNIYCVISENYEFIKLPETHLPIYFNSFPHVAAQCLKDPTCKYTSILKQNYSKALCWGYEHNCQKEMAYSSPECSGDHNGWVENKELHLDTFYHQADFGYVHDQIDELRVMCVPELPTDSSLECSKYLRYYILKRCATKP